MKNNAVAEKAIQIHKDKKRFNFVRKDELVEFLRTHFDDTLRTKMPKSELEEMAYSFLNPDTLELFCKELDGFGLSQGDAAACLSISASKIKKLIDNNEVSIKGYYKSPSNRHIIYSIVDVLDIVQVSDKIKPKKIKEDTPILCTPLNLAQALYNINKSARKSRDTKVNSFENCSYTVCKAAKTRSLNLYHLKDVALQKMIDDGLVKYLGIHCQIIDDVKRNYLKVYEVEGYSFHVPYDGEVMDDEITGTIEGKISAEKTKKTTINFMQAVKLLESYCGAKATGTYNKQYAY